MQGLRVLGQVDQVKTFSTESTFGKIPVVNSAGREQKKPLLQTSLDNRMSLKIPNSQGSMSVTACMHAYLSFFTIVTKNSHL